MIFREMGARGRWRVKRGGESTYTGFTGAAVADTDEFCDVIPWL